MSKSVSIHIAKDSIHIIEGKLDAGNLNIFNSIRLDNISVFFKGDKLANMNGLVRKIIYSLKEAKIETKELNIVYDSGSEVDFYLDENFKTSRADSLDLKNLFKKDKDNTNEATKKVDKEVTGTIRHRKSWGQYMTESERGEMYTTSHIERDFVESIIIEFSELGCTVNSIELPETAIIYLRKFIPYNYDNLNKIIVRADSTEFGTIYIFTKDAPSNNKRITFQSYSHSFSESCYESLYDEIQKSQLKNPQIILIGNVFKDQNTYLETCNTLSNNGIKVVDIYNLWENKNQPENTVQIINIHKDYEVSLDGGYGVCLANLLRTLETKPENFKNSAKLPLMSERGKSIASAVLMHIACLMLVVSLGITGISLYEMFTAKNELETPTEATSSKLRSMENKRDLIAQELNVIYSIDPRYNDIFKFINSKINPTINVASIDTLNMIPVSNVSDSNYSDPASTGAEGTEAEQTEEAKAEEFTRQILVIRGYSTTSDGPVELHRSLMRANLGETRLTGVEQINLPSGEILFAFEMTLDVN